jgi:hypothetical protein
VVVKRSGGVCRLMLTPDVVDQSLSANDLVRLQNEERKDDAALRAA